MDNEYFGSISDNDNTEDIKQHYGNNIPSSSSHSHDLGCCDPIHDDNLMSAIAEFVLQAQMESIEEMDSNCIPNHVGLRSYQLRAKYGAVRLQPLNWVKDYIEGQVRFKNTVDYPFPVRLIFSTGYKDTGVYIVSPKGTHTRSATKENEFWIGQTSLFSEYSPDELNIERDDLVQNYWVYVDSKHLLSGGWWITIRIALPHSLNSSGRVMEIIQDRAIFDKRITPGIDNVNLSLPPNEEVEIEISDLDSIDNNVNGQADADL